LVFLDYIDFESICWCQVFFLVAKRIYLQPLMDDTVSVFLVLGMFILTVLIIVRTIFRVRVMCFVLPVHIIWW